MGVSSFLQKDEFTLIAEIDPPKGVDLNDFFDTADRVRGRVEAVAVTDSSSAIMRMTPLAPCRALVERNIEPIMVLNGRDRNRISFQGDLLAGWQLGVKTVLFEMGEDAASGDQPMAQSGRDLSMDIMLQCVQALNDGRDLAGEALAGKTAYTVGVSLGVSDDVNKNRRIAEEIKRYPRDLVHFLVLGPTYDVNIVDLFAKQALDAGIHLFASVILLKSVAMIRYFNDLPGLPSIPNEFLKKMVQSPLKKQAGLEIAAEFVRDLEDRCKGASLVALGWGDNLTAFLSKLGR